LQLTNAFRLEIYSSQQKSEARMRYDPETGEKIGPYGWTTILLMGVMAVMVFGLIWVEIYGHG
jgi:hypothetical protein